MGRRLALLIATYEYQDTQLRRLTAPAHDAEALAEVLGDPDIADFEVTTLVNEPHHRVGEAIGEFYRDRRRDDLTLLYFTGHGLKDDNGRLYLAMANTRRDTLLFTALSAEQIDQAMAACTSRRQVLILDCCYSGAFPAGRLAKADPEVHTLERFHGQGRTVLTASDSTQYSFEGDTLRGDSAQSVFTRYLVAGLRDGSADLDGDGDITLDELYSYVHERVVAELPQQRPKKQDNVEGRTIIARNVNWTLPAYLGNALASPIAANRLTALDGLDHLHRIGNAAVRTTVRTTLEALTADDSRQVSAAATARLAAITPPPPATEPPEPPAAEPPAPASEAVPERGPGPEPSAESAEPRPTPEPAGEPPAARLDPARSTERRPPSRPEPEPVRSAEPPARRALPGPDPEPSAVGPPAARPDPVRSAEEPTAPTAEPAPGKAPASRAEPRSERRAAAAWALEHRRLLAWLAAAVVVVVAAVFTVVDLLDDSSGSDQAGGATAYEFGSMTISPDGRYLYVSSVHPARVSMISTTTWRTVAELNRYSVRADRRAGLAVSPDGAHVYLAEAGAVTSFETAGLAEPTELSSMEPAGLAVGPTGDRLFAVFEDPPGIVAIHPGNRYSNSLALDFAGGASDVVVSPDGSRVYAGGADAVHVVDTTANAVSKEIAVCADELAADAARDRLYALCDATSEISVVDPASGTVEPLPLDGGVGAVAVGMDGSIYAAYSGASSMVVIHPVSHEPIGKPIDIESGARAIVPDLARQRLYTANWNGSISLVDTATNTVEQVAARWSG
jgi:DNA-binding beta-propeller fold protein YncE